MLSQVEWGIYRVGDLFKIEHTLSFNSEKLNVGTEYDYITRTSLNQGILQTTGFVNNDNINSAGNWSLGLLQMDFFYRTKPWYAGQFVRKVTTDLPLTKNTALFFTVLLNSLKHKLLSVLVRDVDKTFIEQNISLPTKNGKIDFDFMERFVAELEVQRVAELEVQRVAELEAYLTATGLKDYELTAAEQKALDDFEKLKWTTFNLEDLFGKSTRGKRLKGDDRIAGDLPFVTAGEADEGISAFISNKVEIFEANTTTIDMFGSAKYRNYRYGADDHVAVVHTEKLSKFAAIFTTSAIHKASHTGKFDYSRNFYAKDADELDISLPVCNNKPDYHAMELLISAIQKLVIKDVVKYSDRKIAATKQCCKHSEDL